MNGYCLVHISPVSIMDFALIGGGATSLCLINIDLCCFEWNKLFFLFLLYFFYMYINWLGSVRVFVQSCNLENYL